MASSIKLVTDTSKLYSILQFPPDFNILDLLKAHAEGLVWYTLSKTPDEVSLLLLPKDQKTLESIAASATSVQPNWISFKIAGILDFSLVGILAEVVNPLKGAEVPVFVVSTFNTDYIFVKQEFEQVAIVALKGAGLQVDLVTLN